MQVLSRPPFFLELKPQHTGTRLLIGYGEVATTSGSTNSLPGRLISRTPPFEGEDHIRPVTWEEWITLPIREQDEAVHTVRGAIRVPTLIVAVNYAKVPKKRPKLCARAIRERDRDRCQYTGRVLRPDEGSLDHVVPRSRGGKDAWENLVWSAKEVNQRKADRLPHEAGLKLRSVPRAPKELPVSVLIRNAHGVAEWRLFIQK